MREDGEQLGRFKVRSLMRELDLVSKQPGSHAYKRATVERLDIPNTLNREFDVPAPNQVWCGDITYIWAQGKWHYLAVVLDLCTRRIVGWALSEKPDAELVMQRLEHEYELLIEKMHAYYDVKKVLLQQKKQQLMQQYNEFDLKHQLLEVRQNLQLQQKRWQQLTAQFA